MKFVIQRVTNASVRVAGEIVGQINKGLVVLIGFTQGDKASDFDFASNKLLNLRLWDDANNPNVRWKESVKSLNLEILLVSQFTLYSILKGNKPDFHNALEPESARKLYDEFVKVLRSKHTPEKIQTGMFGEMMDVSLNNEGPVTINWEYPEIKAEIKENDVTKTNKQVKNKTKSESSFPITQEELNSFNNTEVVIEPNCNKLEGEDSKINV